MRSPPWTSALPFAAALALLPACAARPPVARLCDGGCDRGTSCVLGRCRPLDESPAPAEAMRVVLAPSDVAVISSRGSTHGDLPEAVAFGRDAGGTIELLLRFTATWRDDAQILSAFIVLDPLEGAPPTVRAIAVETARILEPWAADSVSWGRQPRLDLAQPAGSVRARPPSPVRIDVTALVREWGKRLPDDHGVALLVAAQDAQGAAFSMGVTGGSGPRLEAYVR